MVWVRIDDHFDEHPKIASLSDSAVAQFVCGLAYCNRMLTDGFIPRAIGLTKLRPRAASAIRELEHAALWTPCEGGWTTHDYLDYQPSKQQVEEEQSKKRAAGQAGGRASAQARASAGVQRNGNEGPNESPTDSQAKSKPVPGPVPGPNSVSNETGHRLRVVGEPAPKPEPKPTPVGTLLDKVKTLDPSLDVYGDHGFTGRKLKENPDADLDLIAEAYVSFRHGEWPGSKMLRESGALAWVIGDVGGYAAWKAQRRRGVGLPADRTGIAN